MKTKVLIVDDEPAVRRALRRALEGAELTILEAEDGDVGRDLARRERPAVALVDIHMPKLDGIEAAEEIRELSPETSVIVISGDLAPSRSAMARDRGAAAFLPKPITPGLLRAAVMAELAPRRAP